MTARQFTGLILLAIMSVPALAGAQDTVLRNANEAKLIAVLKSEAPLNHKTLACEQLAVVGTEKSVGVLAGLLGEKVLGDYARMALEPMKYPSVDDAFRAALGKLKGRMLAGVINSIGIRRDAKAVGTLQKFVSQGDRAVAISALAALGRIANDEATGAIRKTLYQGPATLRAAAADAALVAARRLLSAGKRDAAVSLYNAVGKADVPPHVRTSAVYGSILARGAEGLPMILKHLKGKNAALIAVSLRAARELPGAAVSAKLAAELGNMRPDVQVMLIKTLTDRGDPSVHQGIAALAASKIAAVRLEALRALGRIGGASAAPVLLNATASEGKDASVALASLRSIEGDGVGEAILKSMKIAEGKLRVDLISVLSDRRYAPAAKPMLAEAAGADQNVARAAFKALGVLAAPGDLPAMIKLMPAGGSGLVAAQAEASIVAVAAKIPDPSKRADPVLGALASAKKADRRAGLIRILGKIGGDKALAAVVKAADSPEADIKDAAVRALADWPDTKASGVLLDLVKSTKNKTHRILALRGHIRLLGVDADRDPKAAVRKYAAALDLARQAEIRKLALSGLAGVAHGDALKLVVPLLDDAEVRGEAVLAAVSIARATMGAYREQARAAMEKVLAVAPGTSAAADAKRIIRHIGAFGNCISGWLISGPYVKNDMRYDQLFDTPFAPETPDGKGVVWRIAPAGRDFRRPYSIDLLAAIGGSQRVAYALTWIYNESKTSRPVRLDFGSDDGIKAWLNGRLVHSNNTTRAAMSFIDEVPVTLKPGWNPLLLKITQNNLGWEFNARVVTRKGERIDGVRVDCTRDGDWTLPAPPAPGKAVRIFDGKTFDGWEGNLKYFRIVDRAIVGGTLHTRIPHNEFLCTKKKYSDFELRLKVKLAGGKGNAGVQFRTRRIPNHHEVSGYQADMGANWWGCLYDESRRRKVLAGPNKAALAKVLKRDGWNDYVIRCTGARIQLFLNGLKTVDYVEPSERIATTGIIGLQIHGGPASEAWYKDITIVELAPSVEPAAAGQSGFAPLFDGKSLKGWTPTMSPKTEAQKAAIRKMFRAENGAIVIDTLNVDVKDRMGGYLATEKKYGDFVLRLRMQIERKWDRQGNSGIEVRNGLQFDVHPPEPTLIGWVWDHGPKSPYGWLSPIREPKKKSFTGGAWKYAKTRKPPKGFKFYYADQPPGWNDVEITCQGPQFKFALNGVVMSDYDGTRLLRTEARKDYQTTAPIMFQSHGKDGVIIRYKDIRVKELAGK